MSDYQPISCAAHSELELHIMHRQRLRIRWHEGDVVREESALPIDVAAERGAEFLHLRTDEGGILKLRLDTLLHVEPA